MNEHNTPLLTVVCTTFQHASFIRSTLDGFVAQECSFPFEVIVHDDASKDGTAEIILEYARRYPDLILPIIQPVNVYSRGERPWLICFEKARGKYVAICEGDDYWTDPLKLQKQVDFLEAHPDFSLCFHRAMLLKQSGLEEHSVPDDVDYNNVRCEDLLRTYNFIATASVVYRRSNEPLPLWFWKLPFTDLGLYIYLSGEGKFKCLPEFMSVYRISETGAWSKLTWIGQQKKYLRFYTVVGPHLTPVQREIADSKRKLVLKKLVEDRYPGNSILQKLFSAYLRITHPL